MLDIPDYFHVFDLNTHDQPLVVYEEELKHLYKEGLPQEGTVIRA